MIASRSEQSESQLPSDVSAVLVTLYVVASAWTVLTVVAVRANARVKLSFFIEGSLAQGSKKIGSIGSAVTRNGELMVGGTRRDDLPVGGGHHVSALAPTPGQT